MIGLTSISFRSFTRKEIVSLAKEAGLDGIEWGSDVHVPAGDQAAALEAVRLTQEAGLAVTSYGSYMKAGEKEAEETEFGRLLDSAAILNAPVIRVWAGTKSPSQAEDETRQRVRDSLSRFVEMARPYGIKVATEYHRNTLTENADSAVWLLDQVPGLYTYWQPNPEIPFQENLTELKRVRPRLLNVHVFQWTGKENVRHPLQEGMEEWKAYVSAACAETALPHDFLLEFVMNDQREQCLKDAAVLRQIVEI